MTIVAWRIYKPKHARTAFTGKGASLYGGRFNSKGMAVVYTSQSIALASLEMLVHLQSEELLEKYLIRQVSFDEELVEILDPWALPRFWRSEAQSAAVQRIGDEWIGVGRSPVLQVPSAVVPSESNFLLNPHHSRFHEIAIGRSLQHQFDPRLFKRVR